MPPRPLSVVCLLCTGLLSTALVHPAAALDPRRSPSQYVHRVWSLDDGLPQATVNDVTQDADGYLWLATYGGLARFDGARFQVYTQADHPGLPSDRLLCLEKDAEGALWIGTERSGLAVLRDGQITRFEPPDGRSLGGVATLHFGRSSGNLWIGTNRGLVRRGASGWRRFGASQGLPEVLVTSILETPEGDLWVGTLDGLWRRRGSTFVAALGDLVKRGTTVQSLLRDRAGRVWIGAGPRLLRWSPGGAVEVVDLGQLAGRIHTMLEDRDGNLWIGLHSGVLVRLDESGPVADRRPEHGTAPTVIRLFEDREGNLWIGTRDDGLHQLTNGAAISYGGARSPLGASVVPIVADGAGGVWAGLNCGGLAHLDAARRTRLYVETDGLTNTCVWSLARDAAGRLWIGTMGGGLFTLRGDRVVSAGGPPTPGRVVRALLQSRHGHLLAGTDDGVFRVVGRVVGASGDGATQLTRPRFDPLPGTAGLHVVHLSEDDGGALWIGAEEGLFLHREASGAAFLVDDELAGVQVRSVYHDRGGSVWIGTYGQGLYRLDGGRLRHVGQRQGLGENVVSLIVEDGRGRFWLTGNHGVYRVPRHALEAVLEGRQPRFEVTRFGADDGMASSECNGGGQPAGLLTADGELWVPTLDGVAVLDTHDTLRASAAPPVRIESVTLDGVAVDPRRPAAFPAGARNLEIRYTALSFADPRRVQFRYRLQGRDATWIEAGGRRVAYYPFLPPGDNRFDVIAANADGVWGPQGASFSFSVSPRLVDTPAPWLLAFVAALLLAGAAVWLRLRTVRNRERRLAADVAARTAELREAQARLEAANRRLARLARVDPLTGIANRRSLMERLDAEWRRAARHQRSLGLLMIDLDQFKRYNDLHGHPTGDECLRQVTALLAGGLRRADEMLARYGGEELAAVVPETSEEDLRLLAETLRRRVAAARIQHGDSTVADHVTVSIGGAVTRPAAWDSLERLVAAADAALYRAKAAGRDRVETVDLGVSKEVDIV